ncbi:DUF4376 domain-containing protein [Vreelandella sulfidaeris]|uniref:DUF4376 domain-containing protein n=1 Tax=Vreelandella sulfidaeris TaxID=115553 RepID=UPI0035E67AB5
MNIKNPVFNAFGGINAEIEHSKLGWIPCTLHPDDAETAELYAKAEPDAAPAPAPVLADVKTAKRAALEAARKDAEREGVTVEGIRYAGDPSNRQALSEALDLAAITDQTHFSSWKDSDGQFHAAHPVADVHAALLAIGQRRGELIDREGALNEQISAATDVETLEAIQW